MFCFDVVDEEGLVTRERVAINKDVLSLECRALVAVANELAQCTRLEVLDVRSGLCFHLSPSISLMRADQPQLVQRGSVGCV
jgi:hypothetical protein